MSVHRQYKLRIGSAPVNFRTKTNSPTKHKERQTSNSGAASEPAPPDNTSVPHDGILSPPNGQKNEVRGFDESEEAHVNTTPPSVLKSVSSPRPSPPLHGGEEDGFASANPFDNEDARASIQSENIQLRTSNKNASDSIKEVETLRREVPVSGTDLNEPKDPTPNPGSASVPLARPETRRRDSGASRSARPPSTSISEPTRNHITRQEFQRELNSLRRLIESRK